MRFKISVNMIYLLIPLFNDNYLFLFKVFTEFWRLRLDHSEVREFN